MSKTPIIGDSMSITINFQWLIKIMIIVCAGAYGVYKFETRINDLEKSLDTAVDKLMVLEQERKTQQEKEMAELEEKIGWYEHEVSMKDG